MLKSRSKKKLVFILGLYIFIFVEKWYNTILCIIFQYGWEPVLIHRIPTGFKAILENILHTPSKVSQYFRIQGRDTWRLKSDIYCPLPSTNSISLFCPPMDKFTCPPPLPWLYLETITATCYNIHANWDM